MKQRIQVLVVIVFAGLCALRPAAAKTGPEIRAVVGATVIDGAGNQPRPATVWIRNGHIEKITPPGEVPEAPDDQILQAAGKYVIPGLIDAHIHYRDYYAELLLNHGITTVVEWGGSPVPWILAQREGVARGQLLGPRIFTCGDSYPQQPQYQNGEYARQWLREMIAAGVDKIDITYPVPPEVLRVLIEGAHEAGMRASGYPVHTREAIELGLDAIKHTYTVGLLSQTTEALKPIYEQAHLPYRKRTLKLPLVGSDYAEIARYLVDHDVFWIPTLVKDFKVIHDRVDQFEVEAMRLLSDPQLTYIPREDMFLMATNQFGVGIPTPGGFHFHGLVEHRFDPIDYDSAAWKEYHDSYRNLQGLIRAMVDMGGYVLAGTAPHSYVVPGLSFHQELELLVDAGLTPAQAIQAGTVWAARYLQVEDRLGTVEAGKLADLVVLDENPLEDIRHARRISAVIQGGRLQPLGYHFSYRNPIPRNTQSTAPGAASPTPVLEKLSSETATRGSGPLELTLYGDYFLQGAVVYFDSTLLSAERVSPRELRVTLPARLLDEVGTHWIEVVNPPPGRSTSRALSFLTTFPPP